MRSKKLPYTISIGGFSTWATTKQVRKLIKKHAHNQENETLLIDTLDRRGLVYMDHIKISTND